MTDINIYIYSTLDIFTMIGERDTYRGNTIENRGCLFIYIFGRTYVILYFDPHVFLCSLRVRPRPKLH